MPQKRMSKVIIPESWLEAILRLQSINGSIDQSINQSTKIEYDATYLFPKAGNCSNLPQPNGKGQSRGDLRRRQQQFHTLISSEGIGQIKFTQRAGAMILPLEDIRQHFSGHQTYQGKDTCKISKKAAQFDNTHTYNGYKIGRVSYLSHPKT